MASCRSSPAAILPALSGWWQACHGLPLRLGSHFTLRLESNRNHRPSVDPQSSSSLLLPSTSTPNRKSIEPGGLRFFLASPVPLFISPGGRKLIIKTYPSAASHFQAHAYAYACGQANQTRLQRTRHFSSTSSSSPSAEDFPTCCPSTPSIRDFFLLSTHPSRITTIHNCVRWRRWRKSSHSYSGQFHSSLTATFLCLVVAANAFNADLPLWVARPPTSGYASKSLAQTLFYPRPAFNARDTIHILSSVYHFYPSFRGVDVLRHPRNSC